MRAFVVNDERLRLDPRTSTFSRPPSSRKKKGWTTSSGETAGSPFGSFAMPSKKRTAW